jgi:hypothetical protein
MCATISKLPLKEPKALIFLLLLVFYFLFQIYKLFTQQILKSALNHSLFKLNFIHFFLFMRFRTQKKLIV